MRWKRAPWLVACITGSTLFTARDYLEISFPLWKRKRRSFQANVISDKRKMKSWGLSLWTNKTLFHDLTMLLPWAGEMCSRLCESLSETQKSERILCNCSRSLPYLSISVLCRVLRVPITRGDLYRGTRFSFESLAACKTTHFNRPDSTCLAGCHTCELVGGKLRRCYWEDVTSKTTRPWKCGYYRHIGLDAVDLKRPRRQFTSLALLKDLDNSSSVWLYRLKDKVQLSQW